MDHHWVGLGVPINGVRAPVDRQSAMEVKYRVSDGPRVHGRREMSGLEDGNVVIVNQHPASVAAWYVGHWSQ